MKLIHTLFVAPVLLLASSLISPALKSGARAQVDVIAHDPTRWYWYTLLLIAGSFALVPALAAVAGTIRSRLGGIGGGLAVFGALVAAGDAMTQLVFWQMGAKGADKAQMAALMDRFQNAGGSGIVFGLGAVAFVLGSVLLAVGLVRERCAPTWAALAMVAGLVANIVAFTASSNVVVIASWAILLAGMAGIARARLALAGEPRQVQAPGVGRVSHRAAAEELG
jgi:hypothetical protein